MIRAGKFVDEIPEVVPHLLDVTGFNRDEVRGIKLISFAGKISVDIDTKRSIAGFDFVNGIPIGKASDFTEAEIMRQPEQLLGAYIVGDGYNMLEDAIEGGLGAMVRTAELDFKESSNQVRREIGGAALSLTRIAGMWSINSTHRNYRIDDRDPDSHVKNHQKSYSELFPYMTRRTRRQIDSYSR